MITYDTWRSSWIKMWEDLGNAYAVGVIMSNSTWGKVIKRQQLSSLQKEELMEPAQREALFHESMDTFSI